jgi:hypothetical protein
VDGFKACSRVDEQRLTRLWQTDVKYNSNLAVDLKRDEVVMLPRKGRWEGDMLVVETIGFIDRTCWTISVIRTRIR